MATNSIGQNIKALREKASLTQEELALKLNISLNVLVDWEVDYGGPNGDQMMLLVDIFNVSYNEIAGRVNKTTWSLQDGITMASLSVGIVMFFQTVFITKDKGYSLIQLWLNLLNKEMGSVFIGMTGILVGAFFISLLVMLFLSRQNPRRFTFHGNPTVALLCTLLLISVGALLLLFNSYGELTIYSWILLVASALPLFFYYGYRKEEVK